MKQILRVIRNGVALAIGLAAGLSLAPDARPYSQSLLDLIETFVRLPAVFGGIDLSYLAGFALISLIIFRLAQQFTGIFFRGIERVAEGGPAGVLQSLAALGIAVSILWLAMG